MISYLVCINVYDSMTWQYDMMIWHDTMTFTWQTDMTWWHVMRWGERGERRLDAREKVKYVGEMSDAIDDVMRDDNAKHMGIKWKTQAGLGW